MLISQLVSYPLKETSPGASEDVVASAVDQWVEDFVEEDQQQHHHYQWHSQSMRRVTHLTNVQKNTNI